MKQQQQRDNTKHSVAAKEREASQWWNWEFGSIGVLFGLMEVQHDILLPRVQPFVGIF